MTWGVMVTLRRTGTMGAVKTPPASPSTPLSRLPSQVTIIPFTRPSQRFNRSNVVDHFQCHEDAVACMLQCIAARCHAKVNSLLTS